MSPPSSAESSNSSAQPPVHAPAAEDRLDLPHLEPGQRWRGRYDILEQLADITHGRCFEAVDSERGGSVVVRSFRVNDASRASVWAKLTALSRSGAMGLIEAVEVEGRRVEVVALQRGTPLTKLAGDPVDENTLERMIRTIAEFVHDLHRCGLVHLNLNPGTILWDAETGTASLAGLEAVADYTSQGALAVTMDPFYAPPEAVGLYQYHRGPLLKAWDWWSVGRIVQELSLGKHVFSIVLGRDVTRHTPELMIRAEQVLKEREDASMRPGAVERMTQLSERLRMLLRGLLSSCREARWAFAHVDRWLRGDPVTEHYHLSQSDRLFVWRDQAYSLPEAAELFSRPEHWQESLAQVFTDQTPGTLAYFVAQMPGHREARERLAELSRLRDAAAFQPHDKGLVHEVVTGLGLLMLSGLGATFRVRGCRVDGSFLEHLLADEAQPAGFELVQVLVEDAVVLSLGSADPTTSRRLDEVRRTASAAVSIALRHRWLKGADKSAGARLWRVSLETDEQLTAGVVCARALFAATRDQKLDALFRSESLNHSEKAVLVFTVQRPSEFGFVTHAEWNSEESERLLKQRIRLASAASLMLLAGALRSGPHLIGRWSCFAACWLPAAGLVALAFPSRGTLALAVVLFISAALLRWFLFRRLREYARQAKAWDGVSLDSLTPGACVSAAQGRMEASTAPSLKGLLRELRDATAEAKAISGGPPFQPVAPTRFRAIKLLSMISAVLALAAMVFLARRIASDPPSIAKLERAWIAPESVADAARPQSPKTGQGSGAIEGEPGEATPGTEQVAWSFRRPAIPNQPRIYAQMEATAEQARAAEDLGERVCAAYRSETIDALIAVRIPATKGVGLMLYDGRAGKLADRRVYELGYVPLARSWVQLEERVAIYLDERAAVDLD